MKFENECVKVFEAPEYALETVHPAIELAPGSNQAQPNVGFRVLHLTEANTSLVDGFSKM